MGINQTEIENSLAIQLADSFYTGFGSQEPPITIEKAIKWGCKNFIKRNPDKEGVLSLWKDGKKISYAEL